MPTLQQRVAARGFPVVNIAGQSGQGALPDSTLPAAQVPPGSPTASWTDPNTDPASVAASLPPPEAYVTTDTLWGLSGAVNPDNTPRTHAAPVADQTLPPGEANAELEATHAPEFTGVQIRQHPPVLRSFDFGQQLTQGSPPGPLQPLSGQIRSMAGYDGVQGYGGGGDGEGGTNATMPLTTLDRQFPGETYHGVFLNAAEVPFLSADAVQYIAAAPELPQWMGGGFDVPTASVSAQDVTVADSPAQGPALPATTGLLPSWGSLGG